MNDWVFFTGYQPYVNYLKPKNRLACKNDFFVTFLKSEYCIYNFLLFTITTSHCFRRRHLRMRVMGTDWEGKTSDWCFRDGSVLRVSWAARRTNKWVLDTIRTRYVVREQMALKKLCYIGYIMQRSGFDDDISWAQWRESGARDGHPFLDLMILRRGLEWMWLRLEGHPQTVRNGGERWPQRPNMR